jgi:hypothetical protein
MPDFRWPSSCQQQLRLVATPLLLRYDDVARHAPLLPTSGLTPGCGRVHTLVYRRAPARTGLWGTLPTWVWVEGHMDSREISRER